MSEFYYDEQSLMKKVASGDRGAFNQLYTAQLDNVYNYIYLFTKSKEETEEILQEVFVSIWENKENLAVVNSFKHYVFRAAKNKLLNHVRHKKIRNKVFSEIEHNTVNIQEATDYEVTYREYHRLIQEAVETLPPKRKLIFKMNIEEGISYDEIADHLNISKSVVKKQFYKACHFVRQYLYKKGDILSALFISLTYSIIRCIYFF